MGQITTTQNLVAIKEVRHAGQQCPCLKSTHKSVHMALFETGICCPVILKIQCGFCEMLRKGLMDPQDWTICDIFFYGETKFAWALENSYCNDPGPSSKCLPKDVIFNNRFEVQYGCRGIV